MGYWLVKSEPGEYSYDDLEREGRTHWDGVRNYQARKNLSAMQRGDEVLFYHSVSEKAVVGTCQVDQEAYPDPTDDTGKWVVVDVIPKKRFANKVTLEAIKNTPALADIPLIRQSRLSVMPLSEAAYQTLVEMGN